MKRRWKTALVAVSTTVGIVLLLIAVACWTVFTPARLTDIVNRLSDDHLDCESHFGRVELTLLKSFPDIGIAVDSVVLINPYRIPDDAPLAARTTHSDTVASIRRITLGIDIMAYFRDRSVVVRQLRVDDARANLYTAPDGWNNFAVLKPTEATDSDDTPATAGLPPVIELDKISVNNLSARYCNLQQRMLASVDNLDARLCGHLREKLADGHFSTTAARLCVTLSDSVGNDAVDARLGDITLSAEARGSTKDLNGVLALSVSHGDISLQGQPYTTEAMRATGKDLLSTHLPFHADIENRNIALGAASRLNLAGHTVEVWGTATLADPPQQPEIDLHYAITQWQVSEIMALLPPTLTKYLDGISVSALASVTGTAKGAVAAGTLPQIDAVLDLEAGTIAMPDRLPMPIEDINARISTHLNLSGDSTHAGTSQATVEHLTARMDNSRITLKGSARDLLGNIFVQARLRGDIDLADLRGILPDTMPIALQGKTRCDLNAQGRLSSFSHKGLPQVKAHGALDIDRLDCRYDSLHAAGNRLHIDLAMHERQQFPSATRFDIHLSGDSLLTDIPQNGLSTKVTAPDIAIGLPDILTEETPLAATFDILFEHMEAQRDSLLTYADTIKLKGSIRNDSTQDNLLKQWHPDFDIDIHRGVLAWSTTGDPIRLTGFEFNYRPDTVTIAQAHVLWGVSDYHLRGRLHGLEAWMSHDTTLSGVLDFTSDYADIDQLLRLVSGMGSAPDTLSQQRKEAQVDEETAPFIVPKDVNIRLNTHISRSVAFGNDLNDLAGAVTINNGTAILDQIGFTCKAARMELTGVYRSPRVNHLFLGLDFHLLDIDIDALLNMIPAIDTLAPMLSAFKGKADFHLAAECNLDAHYRPKMSTLLGAAAISGKELVVLDNAAVAQMARLLQFKNWREKDNNIGIDSISVEAQVFRNEITVYPFLLDLHHYRLCIGGQHTLDNNCNYHLELLKCPLPARLAVDVKGTLTEPAITLGKIQYAELYNPKRQNKIAARTMEIKRLVRQALEDNVRGKQ